MKAAEGVTEEVKAPNQLEWAGRMDDRKLTVYNGRGAFKKSPPQILLQGNWLEQAGFSAGDKITVKCQQKRLIIYKRRNKVRTRKIKQNEYLFCKIYFIQILIAV